MPLSEHEQQLLEQMEQALYAEDPKFASQMQGSHRSRARRRYLIGGLGVAVGIALVLVGINTTMWVGGAGFALLVGAIVFALTPPRRATLGAVAPDGSVGRAPRPKRPSSKGFMQRMEERWDRRKHDW